MGQALWQASAIEIAAGIRERRFSCSAVTISVAERIRALNPKLNAIVADLTDQALAEAAAADRSFKSVAEHGPLFGVPVTIKVNIDVEGQATTNGLAAFADLIAPGDSPVVSNLRRAGAIIIGRTNTPELSMRVTTVNPLHGRTWTVGTGRLPGLECQKVQVISRNMSAAKSAGGTSLNMQRNFLSAA